jgi:hypothetical protein
MVRAAGKRSGPLSIEGKLERLRRIIDAKAAPAGPAQISTHTDSLDLSSRGCLNQLSFNQLGWLGLYVRL